MRGLHLEIQEDVFRLTKLFAINNRIVDCEETIRVELTDGSSRGRGEALGVFFAGETAQSIRAQIEGLRSDVEAGLSRQDLQHALPPGGARAALDCAFWDFEAKQSGCSIWDLTRLHPNPVSTTYTIGIQSAEQMALEAKSACIFPQLKVKLDGHEPARKIQSIRRVRPDASLIVDANGAWSIDQFLDLLPVFEATGVELVEQPLPSGTDAALEKTHSDIPIGGDESILDRRNYRQVGQFYDVINVKIDKAGGLTEALALANEVRRSGKRIMVGNMGGSSLSMAPSYVLAQLATFVDLDGPLHLVRDVDHAISYGLGGELSPPTRALWG
ncbi:MAG: dipeptide epimerase [Pseudomonadota bacterium]